MKYAIYSLGLALLILSACGKDAAKSTSYSTPSTSVVANACSSHSLGESFSAQDGCNTCSCRSNGAMMCTQMMCASSLTMQAGLSQ